MIYPDGEPGAVLTLMCEMDRVSRAAAVATEVLREANSPMGFDSMRAAINRNASDIADADLKSGVWQLVDKGIAEFTGSGEVCLASNEGS